MTLLGRKLSSMLIAAALLLTAVAPPTSAGPRKDDRVALTAKMKEGIKRLGSGEEVQVRLTLLDKRVLAGFIGETGEQQFVLESPETELRRIIEYDQIEQLHGRNSVTGVRVSIGQSQNPFKTMAQLARRRLPDVGRRRERTGNHYLAKPAIVILVVVAVGLVLVGVELGKS